MPGLKDFAQIINSQYGSDEDSKLQELIAKLRGKDFWIWNTEQHKQVFKQTNGQCCFNHIIGLPLKNNQPKPMFDYERLLYDALMNPTPEKDKFKAKHLFVVKATGLGVTEFTLRFMVWLCTCDDSYQGSQMVLVTGPSLEISITLMKRLKSLFARHSIFFEFKETYLEINKISMTCYPSHHLDTFRAIERPSIIFLDEADFFPVSNQMDARNISERYIGKSDPFIILVSTPNAPGGLFDRIEQEDEDACIYKRFRLDYTYGINKIYTQEEINKAKASPSFGREYDLKYLGLVGNSFRTQDILRASSFVYDPDLIPAGVDRVIGIDPAYGGGLGSSTSAFGICITELRDDHVVVLYSEEFEHTNSEAMVSLIWDLYQKYYPIRAILVDSSQIAFIKSLKGAFMDELHEEVDYERQIKIFKDAHCDWRNNLRIQPCYYNEKSSKNMLMHTKSLLESDALGIDKRFDKLLIALHTASDQEGRLQKDKMSHSDAFDSYREALTCYGDFSW